MNHGITAMAEVIQKTSNVLGGQARIGERRIAVWMLVNLRNLGLSDQEIRTGYEPPLSPAELDAAWHYHAAHAQEIDQAIRANEDA